VDVVIKFRVPVKGDVVPMEPENPVQHGDTVTFELTDQFHLISGTVMELRMGPILIGHVTLGTDPVSKMVTATVVFDGAPEVFDGTYDSVYGRIDVSLEYDDSGADSNGEVNPVTILEKDFYIDVPPQPITYVVKKSGQATSLPGR
jgi:hypothetical protein